MKPALWLISKLIAGIGFIIVFDTLTHFLGIWGTLKLLFTKSDDVNNADGQQPTQEILNRDNSGKQSSKPMVGISTDYLEDGKELQHPK